MPSPAPPPDRWLWPILVLAFCHLVAIASAQVINIMVDDIKASLAITDVDFSLLQGFAVAMFAAVVGLPIAGLADRLNRKRIIMVGVFGWTLATIACAAAQSFSQLFAARVFLGIGEVLLFPATGALMLDLVPRARLARAIALFGCGGPAGAAVAMIGGGWLVGQGPSGAALPGGMLAGGEAWRVAFMALGAMGVVALLLLTTFREPVRRGDGDRSAAAVTGILAHLALRWRLYVPLAGSMLALSTAVFATGAWLPTMLMRERAFSAIQTGSLTGGAALVFAVAGTWLVGVASDRFEKARRIDGVLRVSLGAGAVLLAGALVLPLMDGALPTIAIVCALYLILGAPTVTATAAIQDVAPPHMRARLIAIYMLLVGLIPATMGPSAVAVLHEHLFPGTDGLARSLALVDGASAVVAIVALVIAMPFYRAARAEAGGIEPGPHHASPSRTAPLPG